jgi:hypothetical protein
MNIDLTHILVALIGAAVLFGILIAIAIEILFL